MRHGFAIGVFVIALGLFGSNTFPQSAQTVVQNQVVNPAAVVQTGAPGQFQSVQYAQKDRPGQLGQAWGELENAKTHLNAAGGQWGGHKENAVTHINQAIAELERAVDYARAHGTF